MSRTPTLTDLRHGIREYKKVHCPPVSRMRKPALIAYVVREGLRTEARAKRLTVVELRQIIKRFRSKKCPPYSGKSMKDTKKIYRKLVGRASAAPKAPKRVKKPKVALEEPADIKKLMKFYSLPRDMKTSLLTQKDHQILRKMKAAGYPKGSKVAVARRRFTAGKTTPPKKRKT